MDQRTLAFINLHAVLGSLSSVCRLDEEAKKLIEGKDISIGIAVKGGPAATIVFRDGVCAMRDGAEDCVIKLPFSTCEKFNGMVDGTVMPIPSKGFTKTGFLLKEFMKLTDILTKYLRPGEEDLADEGFFNRSTEIMFGLILSAIAQIGNEEKVGRASASYITDGVMKLSIGGGPRGYITARNHRLKASLGETDEMTAYMEFSDMRTARDLFDGKLNAIACIGLGKVRVGGMISQMDNINRIMDRITMYLA